MASLIGSGCTSSKIEESTSSTTNSESHTRTVSLLEKLKAPKHSDLTRKRVVDHNLPPKSKRRSRGAHLTDPKSVSATQCISEFPNENLTVSNSTQSVKTGGRSFLLNSLVNIIHTSTLRKNTQ